jgi:hopanoid biosynthesis associated protein HpnK
MPRLIVHADDLGISTGVNDGIDQAHRNGILTSTSLMASGAAFAGAVTLLRSSPTLDVGVHLTLVGEPPLLSPGDIPSLVDAGGQLHGSAPVFMRHYLAGSIALDEVRAELDAQIAHVRAHVQTVTHLDSHQHLHMLPAIRRVVVDLARRHGIRAMRHPREAVQPYMLRNPAGLPRLAQLLVLNAFCASADSSAIRHPQHFRGFYCGGRLDTRQLLQLLSGLPADGFCELMCHPGSDETGAGNHNWGYRWRDERDALMAPEVRAEIARRGIRLASYADLIA